MTRLFLPLVVFAGLLLAARANAADEPVTFQIPEGWTDISPGAPEANFSGFPPPLVKEARSGKYAAMAFDVAHGTPRFATNVNALLLDGAVSLDEKTLAAFLEEFAATSAKQGLKTTPVESALKDVNGVTWAVIIRQMVSGSLTVRQMSWVIPCGKKHAVITWSAEDDRFDEYRAVFEKASLATTGAHAAPRFDWTAIALSGLVGGVIAALIAILRRPK
jgi:hypothetical protein